MKFYVLTLFPEMIEEVAKTSIIGRAKERNLIDIKAVNIRDFSLNKHKKVDDYPYGGGAGMLMQCEPIDLAYQSVAQELGYRPRLVYLTPQGKVFHQEMAKEYAGEEDLVFLCGHYEGVDERVLELLGAEAVSIGDYVLTGGEMPALIMIDAISRMVEGVLTNDESGECESFENHLLEYPQYTRPPEYAGKKVPEVLLSGHHKNIEIWQREEAIKRTYERRPELLQRAELSKKERIFLDAYIKENPKLS